MPAERSVQVKVETSGTSETLDYEALRQARATAEELEGVTRIIGLESAARGYDPATGLHALMFTFRVETNHLAPTG